MSSTASTIPVRLSSLAARLQRALPTRLPAGFALPGLYSSMLFDRPAWLIGLLLTMLTYGVANTWMLRQIESDYRTRVLDELNVDAAATEQATTRLLRRLELPPQNQALSQPLRTVLAAGVKRPVTEQFIALVQQIGGVPGDKDVQAKLRSQVHHGFTGSTSGLRFLVVLIDPTTGERLVSLCEQADRGTARELQSDSQQEQRKLLVRFGDLAEQEMEPSLRALARFNGWIQWCTVLIAFAIVAMAVRRAWASVGREQNEAAYNDWRRLQLELQSLQAIADPATRSEAVRNRLAEVRTQFDERPYSSLGFLLGVLPSLGFLGTVWGMGAALLDAEGLFSATDKQQVIHGITTQLGFAFDTTLVALLASMLAGAVVVAVRARELNWLQDLEQKYG